jgi:hypothetical protein
VPSIQTAKMAGKKGRGYFPRPSSLAPAWASHPLRWRFSSSVMLEIPLLRLPNGIIQVGPVGLSGKEFHCPLPVAVQDVELVYVVGPIVVRSSYLTHRYGE